MHGYVSDAFGSSLIVPVPKGDNCKGNVFEGYRSVALISVMVFQTCLMHSLQYYIFADSLQFGFVLNKNYQMAVLMLNTDADYFNQGNSDIFLAILDISKAFDNVNHYGLYSKLMEAHVPVCIFNAIIKWYS